MRVERISETKVRIFVSYEDLEERGIDKDEIWQNGRKVQELFWDMMERAYVEVGFEVVGPIAVEAFTMPTEGVVVIVTQVASLPPSKDVEEDVEVDDQVILEQSEPFVFAFSDFEEVIRAAKAIQFHVSEGASLFFYRDKYYLWFEDYSIPEETSDYCFAILSEYGEPSGVTHAMLAEYGKEIMSDNAVRELCKHFG